MARRGPLSPAHKAAISAGLKRYHAARRGSSGASGSKPQRTIISLSTGRLISREEAAVIMFGSAGAARKLAAGKKVKRR